MAVILNFNSQKNQENNTLQNNPVQQTKRSIKPIDLNITKKYPLVAVVIDNHEEALPQSGIEKALVVYESPVEGGITRLLAFFTPQNLSPQTQIGPIRSVRPYFAIWAQENSTVITHVGGSPDALAYIIKNKITDLNEFYQGEYFQRIKTRLAPHNAYTTAEKLSQYIEKNKLISNDNDFFPTKSEETKSTSSITSIKINYMLKDYKANWRYNQEKNSFFREKEKQKIEAKNIIIQTIKVTSIDQDGRLTFQMTGSDHATVCLDGVCKDGIWKKDELKNKTKFYINNQEIKLNPGLTWINIINNPQDLQIEY